MRGECERIQLWLRTDECDLFDVAVHFDTLSLAAAPLPAASDGAGASTTFGGGNWVYKQQGYVNVSAQSHYKCMEDVIQPANGPPPPSPPVYTNCSDTPCTCAPSTPSPLHTLLFLSFFNGPFEPSRSSG